MADIIGAPFGYLLRFIYETVDMNYGLAIIIFALATKTILLPLSIWVQKNSLKMMQLQPRVNEISVRNAEDRDRAAEEQLELYKKEGYKPLLGTVPMLIQIPIIIGLINVVYNPLKYLLKIGADVANRLSGIACAALGVETLGGAGQLTIAKMVKSAEYAGFFQASAVDAETSEALAKIGTLNFNLFGVDLSQTPSLTNISLLLLVPVIAGLSSLLLSVLQNKENVLQKEQSSAGQIGMAAFLTIFSLVFAFLVPAAVGVYWAVGNFAAIGIMYLMNAIFPPKKYIDYEALEASKKALEASRKAQEANKPTREENKKAREDYKRFFKNDESKEIVFYSVKNGFYRYYKDVIERILTESDIVIHYVTSDPRDEVFLMQSERFIPYLIEGNELIYFFMKVDADVVVMTMPEIEKYYYKRSIVRKDAEYIYMFHAMVSTHMQYRLGAFDHYDTVFCVGPHHNKEIRETEELYELPQKKLIDFGYPLLDDLRDGFGNMKKSDDRFQVLIAPSHQDGNIMDSSLDEILESVLNKNYNVIVRPHPQYVKRNPGRIAELKMKYADSKDLSIESDFSSNTSQYTSDVLITDWSGIAMEFSFTTLKPCVFINTPMKVLNEEYKKIKSVPINIQMRSKIGVALEQNEIGKLAETIESIRNGKILVSPEINRIAEETVYNIGSHGKSGADYIIERVNDKRKNRGAF